MAVRTDYRELIRVLQDEHRQRRAREDEEEGWKRVKKAEEDYKLIREETQRRKKRIELMKLTKRIKFALCDFNDSYCEFEDKYDLLSIECKDAEVAKSSFEESCFSYAINNAVQLRENWNFENTDEFGQNEELETVIAKQMDDLLEDVEISKCLVLCSPEVVYVKIEECILEYIREPSVFGKMVRVEMKPAEVLIKNDIVNDYEIVEIDLNFQRTLNKDIENKIRGDNLIKSHRKVFDRGKRGLWNFWGQIQCYWKSMNIDNDNLMY